MRYPKIHYYDLKIHYYDLKTLTIQFAFWPYLKMSQEEPYLISRFTRRLKNKS